MKMQSKLWVRLFCLLTAIICVLGLTACGEKACEHKWGDWTTVKEATCTEAGSQERACAECGEKEIASIQAQGHDWENATCTSPKTCKTCSATEGEALAHTYTVELVKDETLKSAATCTEAAVYYKSCACGAISTSAEDTFSNGSALEHKDENKDHTCDNACGKNDMGTHADSAADNDHVCDYGCGAVLEACADAEGDGNHACDVCG